MSAITPDLAKLATAVDAVLADLETLKANAVTQADKDTIAAMQGKIEAALAPVVVPAGTGN